MFDNLTKFGKIFSTIFLPILYIAMIILCFHGGTFIDPYIGLAYYGFPIIIGISISIFYIVVSIQNRKLHPFIFCGFLLFFSSVLGNYYNKIMTDRLYEIGNIIENYYKDNDTKILNGSELKELKINENIDINIYGNNYFSIEYKNENRFHYNSQYKKIIYKNIP